MMREQARDIWRRSGLTYEILTDENLRSLRKFINDEMIASGAMQGTFRAHRTKKAKRTPYGKIWADLRCRSFYFTHRQAVTFEPDGFIGFAGWADEINVQPILAGFVKWVAHLVGTSPTTLREKADLT